MSTWEPGRPPVVINADDLGMSASVNQAILGALERGYVTSATIMANMPAFSEASHQIVARGLGDRIGVHLVLTDGMPLSEPIRFCPALVAEDGQFRRRGRPVWRLDRKESHAIATELEAQVAAVIAAGIQPSHLDGHHHVHTQWPVTAIAIDLARQYGIPAVRLSRTCGPGIGAAKRLYKLAVNGRISRAGLALTSEFGSVEDVATLHRPRRPLEVMVHPALDDAGRLIDRGHPERLLEGVCDRWQREGRLVSYRELAAIAVAGRRAA